MIVAATGELNIKFIPGKEQCKIRAIFVTDLLVKDEGEDCSKPTIKVNAFLYTFPYCLN